MVICRGQSVGGNSKLQLSVDGGSEFDVIIVGEFVETLDGHF